MEYVWHIVMKNGKEYDVVTDNGDVVSFMERIININTYNDCEPHTTKVECFH